MRRPSIFTERRGELDIKMTPMIDVVFLLLIFFVWTASFQIVEMILPSSISAQTGTQVADPNEPPPPEEDFDNVVVRILWDGQSPSWRINDIALPNLANLKGRLDTIARIKTDAPVILHADPLVPMGHLIDAYDLAKIAGFDKIQIAASQQP